MGKSAPAPDPRMAAAAERTAALGEDYFEWTKDQAKITNGWAAEDRAYAQDTYRPLEKKLVAEAEAYDTPERRAAASEAARATVGSEVAAAADAEARQMAAMGVDPRSGRSAAAGRTRSLASALGKAGAGTAARQRVEAMGDAKKADAVNMGAGFRVNPASAIQISNGGTASGVNTAMSGNQSLASTLAAQHGQQMSAWQQNRQAQLGMFSSLGTVAGAMISSKTKKKPGKDASKKSLRAIMNMPIEDWEYKDGVADGGKHVGAYAEDFKKETGLGDGKSISIIDAIGTTMGAVKELGAKVDKLSTRASPKDAVNA